MTRAQEDRWDLASAAHLYRRAGFGASREGLQRAVDGGRDAALADVFDRREHSPALRDGIRPLLALESVDPLQAWWMSLILADEAPLVERVTLMWHDHFATSFDKVGDSRLMHRQVELFRALGLGDFRELLHAVATDPAMLVWLDGNSNRRGEPNENFAREVMELFALGIGNYSEDDVQEAARAFTGWGVEGRHFVFREQYHDGGEKRIFGQSGVHGGRDAIELVLDHPACARHVARRLLHEFVLPDPDAEQVEEWTAVLVECDWNVGRTLERLLASRLFFSPAARRSRIAGPVEMVAVTCNTLGANVPPAKAAEAAGEMGQSLCRPPSVKGWDGGRTWIHAGSWLARHNYLTALAYSHATDDGRVDLARACGRPEQVDVASAVLELFLPEGADAPLERAAAESAAMAPDTDAALRRVAALVLTAPEYHLI